MRCTECGRDINALGQDNMSSTSGSPLCEDCHYDEVEREKRRYSLFRHMPSSKLNH